MKRLMMTLLAAASLSVTSLVVHSPQARADDFTLWNNVNRPVHVFPLSNKPDYAVGSIAGPSPISPHTDVVYYEVSIENYGSSTAAINNVNLEALMLGELVPAYAPVKVSNGFQCLQQNSTFVCDGGTLAAGQSATIGFPVRGSSAGQGSITVVVNYDHSVDEGDRTSYANNYQEKSVTVTS